MAARPGRVTQRADLQLPPLLHEGAGNRLPNRKPPKYNPAKYELLARYLEALVAAGHKPRLKDFWNPIWMPNRKTDINNNGAFSTDFIGMNYAYPEADYATRAKIWQAHEDYILGFVYFLATSPRVPENMRAEMRDLGAGQRRVHGHGQLAEPALRARGPPHGVGLCHDRAQLPRPARGGRPRWAGRLTGWIRTTASAS